MVDDEPSAGFTWVDGLPLVDARGQSLPIELVVQNKAAVGNLPFVTLTDACRYSRLLLARIAVGASTVQYLVLKMQRDQYSLPAGGSFPLRLTNVAIEEIWRRERENLGASRCDEVVDLLELGPHATNTGPVSFCRHTRKFFRPLCPETLAPLRVCRDDDLLASAGLERYSSSTARYLHAQADGASGGSSSRFYTWSKNTGTQANEGVIVRRRHELYRDAAALFERDDLSPADVQKLEATFPCWTCEHRDECYGKSAADGVPIRVEDRVAPLCYYDSEILAFELLDLHFDELCDALGGARPRAGTGEAASPARELTASRVERVLDKRPGWLFENEAGNRLALEVLHLKLIAFEQLCRGLQVIHERAGRPHLGISPQNVMARISSGGLGLPARWQFSVKLIDLGAQYRVVPLDLDSSAAPELLLPEPDAARTYQSPIVKLSDFSRDVEMRMAAKAVRVDAGRRLQVVEATTRGVRIGDVRPGDVVRIAPFRSLPGLGEGALAGVVDEAGAGNARITVELSPGDGATLPTAFDANATFFRRYQAPCDLYGLGMMLCRALLVNDERDIFKVEEEVIQRLDRLRLAISGTAGATRAWITTTLISQLDFDGPFSSASVLYDAKMRFDVAQPVPDALWTDVMVFAFRLLSDLDDFGFFAHDGDAKALMTSVLDELGELRARVAVSLFGTEARSRDIGAACRELLIDVNASLFSKPPEPEPDQENEQELGEEAE